MKEDFRQWRICFRFVEGDAHDVELTERNGSREFPRYAPPRGRVENLRIL